MKNQNLDRFLNIRKDLVNDPQNFKEMDQIHID
jgi:hypothetical protein